MSSEFRSGIYKKAFLPNPVHCSVRAVDTGGAAYIVFRTSQQPPEVCLFINKRERYSTALRAVCITNLKEANLEALLGWSIKFSNNMVEVFIRQSAAGEDIAPSS